MAQAFGIDAMPNPGGYMPFDRQPERGEPLRRLEQRLGWDQIVAVTVD